MSENPKMEKQFAVSKAVLEIIEKEGILGVTHSKVARKAKVSRPWIYEYIGKEKTHLIEFAANELGRYFSRTDIADLPQTLMELEERIDEGVSFLFEAAEDNPIVVKLFFRYRGASNPLGDVIEKYENQWLEKASDTLAEILALQKEQARAMAQFILTMRMGYAHLMITSSDPNTAKFQAVETFQVIHGILGGALKP